MFVEFIRNRVEIPIDKMVYGMLLMNNNKIIGVEMSSIGPDAVSVDIDHNAMLAVAQSKGANEVAFFHNKPGIDVEAGATDPDVANYSTAKGIFVGAGFKVLDNILISYHSMKWKGYSFMANKMS
jgi:hypothetical protein